MKSNQVIFGDRSNSENKKFSIESILAFNVEHTKHSWLSKKEVHNGNILFVGIVVQLTLNQNSHYAKHILRFRQPLSGM